MSRLSLPLDLNPIAPSIFHPSTPLIFSLQPLLPPHTVWLQSDRPPERCPFLPAHIANPRFSPILGGPRRSLREPLTEFPHSVAPPFSSSTCAQVSVIPRGSPVRGSLPPSICLHHPHTRPPPPCRP